MLHHHHQWFLSPSLTESQTSWQDPSLIKYQVDYLFYQARYAQACDLCERWLEERDRCLAAGGEARGIKREMYEAILVCGVRSGRWTLAKRALEYLDSLSVEDAGLSFVLQKYRAIIPAEHQ